jgi:hypothetical protein
VYTGEVEMATKTKSAVLVPRDARGRVKALDEMSDPERDALFRAMNDRITSTGGKVATVARWLGVDRRTLKKWMGSPELQDFIDRNDDVRYLRLFASPIEDIEKFFCATTDNVAIVNVKVRWLYRLLAASGLVERYSQHARKRVEKIETGSRIADDSH